MRTFLRRRREIETATGMRALEIRDEYRALQRSVVEAHRRVRDEFAAFIDEEPGYDLRPEFDADGLLDLPVDYPLTDWWKSLTFDDARVRWANADDDPAWTRTSWRGCCLRSSDATHLFLTTHASIPHG